MQKKLFFERVVAMGLSAGNEDFVPHINTEVVILHLSISMSVYFV